MIPLADAAPTGAGLAIVGVILLAFIGLVLGAIVIAIVLLAKRARRRRAIDPVPGWPTAPGTPTPPA